MVNMLQYFS